jgi:hypothetical protein
MGLFILVRQSVQIVPVERDGLGAQRDLSQARAPLGVELVAIDADVGRRVLVADEAGLQGEAHHHPFGNFRLAVKFIADATLNDTAHTQGFDSQLPGPLI